VSATGASPASSTVSIAAAAAAAAAGPLHGRFAVLKQTSEYSPMASDGLYASTGASEQPLAADKKPDVNIIIGGKEIACNGAGAAVMLGGVVLAFVAGVALGGIGGDASPPAPAQYGQPAGAQTAMGSATGRANTDESDQAAIDAQETGYELPGQRPVAWAALPSPTTQMNRVAFGSCANQAFPQPFWDTLDSFDPQIYIMGGDNVYGDCLGRYSATPGKHQHITRVYIVVPAGSNWAG
jgi:hypothetical protein